MTAPTWLIAVGVALAKLVSWLRGGKGYRTTVEIRSEAAIEADKKKAAELAKWKQEALDALTKITIEEAEVRSGGDVERADKLLDELREHLADYHRLFPKS